MSKLTLPIGAAYLESVSEHKLKEMIKHEKEGKSRSRLQAAIFRKRGYILKDIADALQRGIGTVYRWLYKLEHEGLEHRHDRKSPGRPPILNPKQAKAIQKDMDKPPSESGFKRGNWNSKMIVRRVCDRFGIKFSRRSALRLAARLGFSYRKPRPVPYNSATPQEQNEFVTNVAKPKIATWYQGGRAVFSIDAASIRNSPTPRRGLRRKGGKDTVSVNHSKKSTHLFGALGDDTLDVIFCEDLTVDSYIELIDYLLKIYKKIGIISDNASALTSKKMREHIEESNGAVEIIYLPPHTPQLNPIEIQWREIKAAIADIFFKDEEEMKKAIIQMIKDKEIPIIKTFEWLLPP